MHKRAITAAAGILAAATLMVGLSATAHAAAHDEQIIFDDADNRTPHVGDIGWMAESNISTGWKEGNGTYTYRPMDTVKRQDMAAFLRRIAVSSGILEAASWKPAPADFRRFKDVTAATPHYEDILWLANKGISEGWATADGSHEFRGMDTIKRQDMAAFLKRLAAKSGRDRGVTPKTDFTDVNAATPHCQEVQWLGGSGISQGYRNANGSWRFGGMISVYRQDMAAFMHRFANLFGTEGRIFVEDRSGYYTVRQTGTKTETTPEKGHYEKTLVSAAVPEKKEWVAPVTHQEDVYETHLVPYMQFADGTEMTADKWSALSEQEQQDLICHHGRHGEIVFKEERVKTGTTTVTDKDGYWKVTPAVAAKYENKWVVDQPATTKGTPIYSKVWVPGSGHWVKR